MKKKKPSQKEIRQYDLSSAESVKFILEQIEEEYIVSQNDKPVLAKLIEEYFWLKEHDTPTATAAKWAEINNILDTFDAKVRQ